MAISNNNVENVKFLRNGNLFTPSVDPVKTAREVALAAMEAQKDNLADGVAILGRYQETGGTVKTLVGFAYISGDTKTLTVFDVDGANADVEALRQEINAKLGDGVSSANTVTAQLAQLSGDTASTSADTSVEGAKRYTDDKISTLDYTGVTTGTGVYVTNVTEADGIVAATTATLPTVEVITVTGQPIIAVAEDKGTISASAGTINAEYVNVVDEDNNFTATNVEGVLAEIHSGYTGAVASAIDALDYTDTAVTKQFVAAVDETNGVISITRGELQSSGKTVVITADGNNVNFETNIDGTTLQKNENGVISVTSSALVQYEGDDDTIQIGAVSDGKRIVSSPLTIQKVTTGLSAEVKEEYHLVGHSGTTIGDPVKIYKDSHIVSINYITNSGDTHYQNLEYVYIDASGNTQTTYVDMSELVLEAEFASGVTITDHVAHGVVDPTSETFLTVGADGFKLSGVQNAINSAVNDLDADVSGNSTHVTVGVVEEDGEITAVTVSESNIANADDLAELSGKTITEVESSNSSISAVTAATTDGTVKVDVTTDASKIKMTGFTADASGFTAITSASTVTDAVEAIEAAFIANEQVIAASFNDLNTRVNTVSGDVDTIKAQYVSGVSINGSATTVTDHVAGFTVESATSATTATGNEAITVQTDANGNITLGLASIDCGTY